MSAERELLRAIRADVGRFSQAFEIEELGSRPWASVTFSGARHRLAVRFEGPGAGAAADAFLDGLAEREFALAGHVLADIALVWDARAPHEDQARLTLEALTVETG